MEERSETKHHYYRGLVTDRPEVSPEGALLASNLLCELSNAVQKRGHRVVGSDLMIETGSGDMLTYPAVSVVQGPFQRKRNITTNPVFVAEALPPSIEATGQYRRTPSIKQYALLSQTEPLIEVHTRHDDGTWRITEFEGLDATLDLTALDCRIPLADLYDGVFDE